MAKYIMEFDYYEDRELFDLCRRGQDLAIALSDYDEWLRRFIKYDGEIPEESRALYQECRDKLHEVLERIGGLP